MLTYQGKIILINGALIYLDDADADNVVANDIPWSTIRDTPLAYGLPPRKVRNDDGTEIDVDTQCVDYTEVPDDTTFLFVLEPAFYEV